jgi:hypothetical protein
LKTSLEAFNTSPIKHNLDKKQFKRKTEMKGHVIKTKFLKIESFGAEIGISKEMQTFIAYEKDKFITTEIVHIVFIC